MHCDECVNKVFHWYCRTRNNHTGFMKLCMLCGGVVVDLTRVFILLIVVRYVPRCCCVAS